MSTQISCIPNCDPAFAIVVTLPVPMVYPIQKIPGPTDSIINQIRLRKNVCVEFPVIISSECFNLFDTGQLERVSMGAR